MEQLNGDMSVEQRVFGLPDRPHPASRNLADEAITAAEQAAGALHAQSEPASSGSTSRSPWRRRISPSACSLTRLMKAAPISTYAGRKTTVLKLTTSIT